jgi:hypothetical protein
MKYLILWLNKNEHSFLPRYYGILSRMDVNNWDLDFHPGSSGLSGYFVFKVDGIDVYFFFSGIVKQL